MSRTEQIRELLHLDAGKLKIFAIVTMLIDHMGAVLIYRGLYCEQFGTVPIRLLSSETQTMIYHIYYVLRGIGRLAFPVFAFFIVEGFLKTRNVRKYVLRIFLFALLSEIPFDLALRGQLFDPNYQNVMFTMLLALLTLMGIRQSWDGNWNSLTMAGALGVLLSIACGCTAAYLLHTDYSFKGVALIVVLYLFRDRKDVQCLTGAAAIAWENWAPLSFILLYFYNGERGKQHKYLFYLFYPIHLLALYGIAHWGIPWYLGIL